MWAKTDKYAKHLSIIGAHFVVAPISMLWWYGNLSAYMDSYSMFSCAPKCADGNTQWTLSIFITVLCPGLFISGPLVKKLRPRPLGVLTMLLCNVSLFGSAWIIRESILGMTFFLGVGMGIAMGITVCIALIFVHGWAPEHAAFLSATVTAFGPTLAVIQNQIITAYVNPNNLKPDAVIGPKAYFSQPEILEKVPGAMIILAIMSLLLQVVGYLLVREPPDFEAKYLGKQPDEKKEAAIQNSEKESSGETIELNKDLNTDHVKLPQSQNGADLKTYGSVQQSDGTDATQGNEPNVDSAVSKPADKSPTSVTAKTQLRSWKPMEALGTLTFFSLWFYGVTLSYGFLLKNSFYKQFGLLYIPDDNFLTLLGSIFPLVSAACRIFFGRCIDKGYLSIQDSIVISLSLNSILLALWFFAPQVDRVLYMILILSMSVSHSVYYMVTPTAALRIFGPMHFPINYGMLHSAQTFVGITSLFLFNLILESLGWFWLFTSTSIINLIALAVVAVTNFNINSSKSSE